MRQLGGFIVLVLGITLLLPLISAQSAAGHLAQGKAIYAKYCLVCHGLRSVTRAMATVR
jgi:mono/diheme cytochrome c family protein